MSRGSKKDKTLLKATDNWKLWIVMITKVWKRNTAHKDYRMPIHIEFNPNKCL